MHTIFMIYYTIQLNCNIALFSIYYILYMCVCIYIYTHTHTQYIENDYSEVCLCLNLTSLREPQIYSFESLFLWLDWSRSLYLVRKRFSISVCDEI